MGQGLRVKHELLLTEQDSALLRKAAKARRASVSYILREALVEWLTARGLLREEKEEKTSRAPSLGEPLETERQKRTIGNERHG
jgi:hypothetical protein